MRASTVARSYAEALFEIADRHGTHEAFAEGFATMTELMDADPRIAAFLETPKVSLADKRRVLRDALADQVPALFLNFILVVLQKRRQRLIRVMGEAYEDLLDKRLGRLHVQVILAHEPDEAAETAIMSELARVLGRSVIPRIRVEPAILGGIIVRTGDQIIDASLRRRLITLRHRMFEAVAPAGAG